MCVSSPISTSSAESADLPSRQPRRDSARSDSVRLSPTPAACSLSVGRVSRTLETCAVEPSLPGFEDALCSPADSLVSRGPKPGSAAARATTAISGRQCATFSRKSGRLGSLVRMCLASSAWGSSRCALIWKTSVTPRNRLLFQLVPLEPGISESECGLLPTLTVAGNYNRAGITAKAGDGLYTRLRRLMPTLVAADHKGGSCTPKSKQGGPNLRTFLNGPLNPRWCEWFMGYPIGHTELKGSATRSSRKSRSNSSASSRRSRPANSNTLTPL